MRETPDHDALLAFVRDAREALDAWQMGFIRGIECPGCGERHDDDHENTCACDHCALVVQSRALVARARALLGEEKP